MAGNMDNLCALFYLFDIISVQERQVCQWRIIATHFIWINFKIVLEHISKIWPPSTFWYCSIYWQGSICCHCAAIMLNLYCKNEAHLQYITGCTLYTVWQHMLFVYCKGSKSVLQNFLISFHKSPKLYMLLLCCKHCMRRLHLCWCNLQKKYISSVLHLI